MNTELLYMEQGELTECEAEVVEMQGKTIIVLASTVFYPQGGGQPYDKGLIKGQSGTFRVDEVRNIDGVVNHVGLLEGEIKAGEQVTCHVDKERRALNSRMHSAGHVVDMAVHKAGFTWKPGKGYSFPDGPYVEYTGDFSSLNNEDAKQKIEAACAELIAEDLVVHIEFMNKEEVVARLPFVPENLPANHPARVVFMGDYGIPCGGTHVKTLKEIGTVTVRKMKLNGDVLRVSYLVA